LQISVRLVFYALLLCVLAMEFDLPIRQITVKLGRNLLLGIFTRSTSSASEGEAGLCSTTCLKT